MVKGHELNLKFRIDFEYAMGIQRYRIHDRCFFPENNNTLVNLCEGTNKTTIEQYQWVSDTTGRIFQNRFCAACNHVTEYVTWKIQTSCKSVLSANVMYLDRQLLSPECDLDLRPPESARVSSQKYKCYRPHVSRCNATGDWKHFNAGLAEACAVYNSPVIVENDNPVRGASSINVYKNIYCLFCNRDELNKTSPLLCVNYADERDGRDGILQQGFRAILDYEQLKTLHRADASQTCSSNEVYDSNNVRILFV